MAESLIHPRFTNRSGNCGTGSVAGGGVDGTGPPVTVRVRDVELSRLLGRDSDSPNTIGPGR